MRARVARSPSGAPSTRPVPDVGSTSASNILIAVVLPAPFGPRNPKISPWRMYHRDRETGIGSPVAAANFFGAMPDANPTKRLSETKRAD
jgi:hypothetical protein